MFKKIGEMLMRLSARFFPSDEQEFERRQEDYFQVVEQARREWQEAKQRFEEVSDPDMVDHAVYAIEAAERRYIYLLKKAREEGCIFIPGRLPRW